MPIKITVLSVDLKQGLAKLSNKPYSFQVCKAVVTLPDGSVDVGELALFDLPPIMCGEYAPEFSVKRSRDGKLEGQITGLVELN